MAKLILPDSGVDQIKVVQITRTELIYNGKECFVVKIRDISEIREKAKLSAENKMLSLMASSVSHEMITPMRCIVHLAGGLEKKLKDRIGEDESIGKEIDLITKTAQLLLNQVKGYLDRDMLSQNMFVPTMEPNSLNSLVEDVCGMLQYEAQSHNFELVMEPLKEDVGASVDKMRTQQILINLVQNAIKYSGEGGKIWVGLKVNHVEKANHIGVTFYVRDEGVGIPLS